MVLVIPGVEVRVTKEVVAPQLAPSGILGLVGLTELQPSGAQTVLSTSRFVEVFGRASLYSMPEAAQAFQNGVAELVVVAVGGASSKRAGVDVKSLSASGGAAEKGKAFKLVAKAPGTWANGLSVSLTPRKAIEKTVLDIVVSRGDTVLESLRGLELASLSKDLKARSDILTAEDATTELKFEGEATKLTLAGGADAPPDAYAQALKALESEPDVDMVLAAVQDFGDSRKVAAIYGGVIAHCARMSAKAQGRIGFGQTPPYEADKGVDGWVQLAPQFYSDRFMLLAPHGVAGAVAGMVGSLEYFQSPTFKPIVGVAELSRNLLVEEQEKLLKAAVVPVATMRGRGAIVVRGLTMDGDQLSVRRVADRGVRGVKMIGDLFIGRLNNESGRGALREKLVEFLVQMERDGAIVPSTDGRDPAFKVNVYSSQDDFAKGIVRVDLAIRPVRAIDYIYATVLVQA